MKRVLKRQGVISEEKYVLKKEYGDFGIYGEMTPSGYFVHQSYLFTNDKIAVVIESYNNICMDEVYDMIDSYIESGKIGHKAIHSYDTLLEKNTLIVHPSGMMS